MIEKRGIIEEGVTPCQCCGQPVDESDSEVCTRCCEELNKRAEAGSILRSSVPDLASEHEVNDV